MQLFPVYLKSPKCFRKKDLLKTIKLVKDFWWWTPKIDARRRYGPPIKDMRAHFDSQFFVIFLFCVDSEDRRRLNRLLWVIFIKSWSSYHHWIAGNRWYGNPISTFHIYLAFQSFSNGRRSSNSHGAAIQKCIFVDQNYDQPLIRIFTRAELKLVSYNLQKYVNLIMQNA